MLGVVPRVVVVVRVDTLGDALLVGVEELVVALRAAVVAVVRGVPVVVGGVVVEVAVGLRASGRRCRRCGVRAREG